MGLPGFEPESMRPERTRIDQATLQAPASGKIESGIFIDSLVGYESIVGRTRATWVFRHKTNCFSSILNMIIPFQSV